jgi:4'-phosphopantetheinyl transferase
VLSLEPAQVQFDRDRRGKPCVAGDGDAGLQFSVTHSSGIGLYALRRGHPVGVDVERTAPGFAWMDVASTIFSRHELDRMKELPDDQRLEAFFALWTRKEAVAKAVGLGLRAEFASLMVPCAPTPCGWSRCCLQDDGERTEISLVDLSLGPEFRGALALVGDRADVRGFEYGEPDGTHPDDWPSMPESAKHRLVLGARSAGDVRCGIDIAA